MAEGSRYKQGALINRAVLVLAACSILMTFGLIVRFEKPKPESPQSSQNPVEIEDEENEVEVVDSLRPGERPFQTYQELRAEEGKVLEDERTKLSSTLASKMPKKLMETYSNDIVLEERKSALKQKLRGYSKVSKANAAILGVDDVKFPRISYLGKVQGEALTPEMGAQHQFGGKLNPFQSGIKLSGGRFKREEGKRSEDEESQTVARKDKNALDELEQHIRNSLAGEVAEKLIKMRRERAAKGRIG